MKIRRRHQPAEAELDITAFMNLMIVLVPALLLGLVFTQITALQVTLPPQALAAERAGTEQQLELIIRPQLLRLNYPSGVKLRDIPVTEGRQQDFETLSLVLQELKRALREKGIEKRSIFLLSEPEIDYQTIVTAMDTARSFKALVAAEVVDAALFPDISFGDAPPAPEGEAG